MQIVALPYNTLLHQSTREASEIQLKDNIVVIDEAHNLLETINNVHSVEITGSQVSAMLALIRQLKGYVYRVALTCNYKCSVNYCVHDYKERETSCDQTRLSAGFEQCWKILHPLSSPYGWVSKQKNNLARY